MTNTELYNILKTLESSQTNPISVFSVRAKLGTKLPYLTIIYGDTDNLFADNKVHQIEQEITLEVYTTKKDETIENLVETLLNNNELPWNKSEAYDDDGQFYLTIYYLTRR